MVNKSEEIRVSVCMVTYNQKKYIAQAIDSVLMQKTNFKFELVIGDDASTDGTTDIVRQYAQKYPDIIRPILHEENVGPGKNSISIYETVKTEYVAVCDGDDYWTDEYKLQKQVDFLDKNPDFNVVFTYSRAIFEDEDKKSELLPNKSALGRFFEKGYLNAEDLVLNNCITPVSVMWRWKLREGFPSWYSDQIMGDYTLHLIHAKESKVAFLPVETAIYRRHNSSMWYSSVENLDVRFKKYGKILINTNQNLKKYYNGIHDDIFDFVIQDIFNTSITIALANCDCDWYNSMILEYPDLAFKFNITLHKNKTSPIVQADENVFRKFHKQNIMLGIIIFMLIILFFKDELWKLIG